MNWMDHIPLALERGDEKLPIEVWKDLYDYLIHTKALRNNWDLSFAIRLPSLSSSEECSLRWMIRGQFGRTYTCILINGEVRWMKATGY